MNVELDGGGNDYHKLLIDVDRNLVDMNSLLVDGKVRYPNGDVQNFSLTEPSDAIREHLIIAFDYGIFRVKLTAYGKTVNGRDFILDVPEYTFLVAEPELPEPEIEESAAENDIDTWEHLKAALEPGMWPGASKFDGAALEQIVQLKKKRLSSCVVVSSSSY